MKEPLNRLNLDVSFPAQFNIMLPLQNGQNGQNGSSYFWPSRPQFGNPISATIPKFAPSPPFRQLYKEALKKFSEQNPFPLFSLGKI